MVIAACWCYDPILYDVDAIPGLVIAEAVFVCRMIECIVNFLLLLLFFLVKQASKSWIVVKRASREPSFPTYRMEEWKICFNLLIIAFICLNDLWTVLVQYRGEIIWQFGMYWRFGSSDKLMYGRTDRRTDDGLGQFQFRTLISFSRTVPQWA